MLSACGKTKINYLTINYSSVIDRDRKKARPCERADKSIIQNEVGTLGGLLHTGCLHSVPACPSLFKNTGTVLPGVSTFHVWQIKYQWKKFYVFNEKKKYVEQFCNHFDLRRFEIFNLLKHVTILNWKQNSERTWRNDECIYQKLISVAYTREWIFTLRLSGWH